MPQVSDQGGETPPKAPRHWEADVLLRDGRTAHLRPIRPDDEQLMVDFYSRVSEESKYYRFFIPMPVLSKRDLRLFTHVDHDQRVALILVLGGRMIGVGRYDAIEPGEAEVAFLVEDAHQGRGIGQLLLEHLAQAGRERGFHKFSAEVLPDNLGMIRTFKDAGYCVGSELYDGVLTLEFSIDPTDTAIGVMESREHRAEVASIEKFFNPRSVAVIGASRKHATIGYELVRNMVTSDFTGTLYVVNTTGAPVSGVPAYPSVTEIPHEVDVAVVAVPAESVQDVVLDCAAKGVHGLIVISSGFAETGDEGRRRQRRLVGLSRSYGLRLIGPNCLGVINTDPAISLNASLAPLMPARGRAGFFCQSGPLGSAILEQVGDRGLGLSTFVSAGNRADLSGNDLLQYWEEDDSTEVVLLYLESIGNPRKFSRVARRVSRRKPVVAVRSGRTTQGVPVGHAVRRVGAPPEAVDAMFRQAGVIQVDTLEEMFDVAQLVAHQPLPRGRRVAVVGNSDALALLASDAAAGVGLSVTKTVFLGAEANAEDFEHALDGAIDDPEVDAVVAVYIPPINVRGEDVANVLATVGEQSDKPIVSTFLAAKGVPELLRVPDVAGASAGRGSVPSYPAPEGAVRALARVVEYSLWLRRPGKEDAGLLGAPVAEAQRLVNSIVKAHPDGHDLDVDEQRELLAAYGIDLWEARPVDSLEEAIAAAEDLGWDVVLKGTGDRHRNRPDLAHVRRELATPADMEAAWRSLSKLINPETVQLVVQKMAPRGVPVQISSLEDPSFGPVVSFGIGGQMTELLNDYAYRIPPLSEQDAADMVREIKSAPLLFGYRGMEVADVGAIERLITCVARIQYDFPQVRSLSLPLVLAGPRGASVLTSAVRIEPVADPRSDWFVRRLSAPLGDTAPG